MEQAITTEKTVEGKLLELITSTIKFVHTFVFETNNFKKDSKGEVFEQKVQVEIKGTLKSYNNSEINIKLENGEIKTFDTTSLKDIK